MLQVSRQTDYGIKALADVASFPPNSRLQTKDIAERQAIPEAYLAKIVCQLAKAGLLRTFRGNDGGVTLARPAHDITMREVIDVLEGQTNFNICSREPGNCETADDCIACSFWLDFQSAADRYLESITLMDLVQTPLQVQ